MNRIENVLPKPADLLPKDFAHNELSLKEMMLNFNESIQDELTQQNPSKKFQLLSRIEFPHKIRFIETSLQTESAVIVLENGDIHIYSGAKSEYYTPVLRVTNLTAIAFIGHKSKEELLIGHDDGKLHVFDYRTKTLKEHFNVGSKVNQIAYFHSPSHQGEEKSHLPLIFVGTEKGLKILTGPIFEYKKEVIFPTNLLNCPLAGIKSSGSTVALVSEQKANIIYLVFDVFSSLIFEPIILREDLLNFELLKQENKIIGLTEASWFITEMRPNVSKMNSQNSNQDKIKTSYKLNRNNSYRDFLLLDDTIIFFGFEHPFKGKGHPIYCYNLNKFLEAGEQTSNFIWERQNLNEKGDTLKYLVDENRTSFEILTSHCHELKILKLQINEQGASSAIKPHETYAEYYKSLNSKFSWSIYHYFAIVDPNEINQIKKISNTCLLDSYNKTPLHYIIAHNFERSYSQALNSMFKLMNDHLETIKNTNPELFLRTIDALADILVYLYLRIDSTGQIQRFLKFLCIEPHGHNIEAKSHGCILSKDSVEIDNPFSIEANEVNQIIGHGHDRISFNCTTLPLNFDLNSNGTLNFLIHLLNEKKSYFYEDNFISAMMNHLWLKQKKVLFIYLLIWSIFMISVIVDLSLGVASNIFIVKLIILPIAVITLIYDSIQAYCVGLWDYFYDAYNFFGYIALFFVVINNALRISNPEWASEYEIIPWMIVFCLTLGFMRWIYYLKAFNSARYLIRAILSIFADMKSFVAIVLFTLLGFYCMMMAFKYGEESAFENLYRTYYMLYDPLEGEMSQSMKIIAMVFPFVLNIVFLNMLIGIFNDSLEKSQDMIKFEDRQDKAALIFTTALTLRFFVGASDEEKRKYLLWAEYESAEHEDEWQGKISSLKKAIKKTNQKIENTQELFLNSQLEMNSKIENIQAKIDKISSALKIN